MTALSITVVGVGQNQLRGHYCYVNTVHIASPVPQSYIFQFGGIGEYFQSFYQYTNRALAIYYMKGDDFSKKKNHFATEVEREKV